MTRAWMIAGTAALVALVACAQTSDEPALSATNDAAALLGNTASSAGDPALTAALRDQIMVDPALVQQANDDTIRPPTMPESGAVPPDGIARAAMAKRVEADTAGAPLKRAPAAAGECAQCRAARQALTLGALAQKQGGRASQCAANVSYSAAWANQLPTGVPLYPDAHVSEAAGANGAGCALRIVSFASSAPMQRLLDWYYTRTSTAGYSAGHRADGAEHVLAGNRAGGGAFMLVMRSRKDGGTDVDLMADGG